MNVCAMGGLYNALLSYMMEEFISTHVRLDAAKKLIKLVFRTEFICYFIAALTGVLVKRESIFHACTRGDN